MADSAPLDWATLLPAALTPLVGREREQAVLRDLLRRDDVRLVTLTGAGGVGKTRLALATAEELTGAYDDGVRFVPLAAITDPQLVLPTIAKALGLQETGARSLEERLPALLHARHQLLVLDNFEQLIEAAALVPWLLSIAPRLHVLVTSRELLRVSGEHDLPVLPLASPDPIRVLPVAEMAETPAVQLFVARAEAAVAGFTLAADNAAAVAAICHRLDGLPLAIELAATRIRLFPPIALLDRLGRRLPLLTGGARDLPARQRTMRDAIAWSYDLLGPEEQALFLRLSVFVGGWTVAAAEAVASEGEEAGGREGEGVRAVPAFPPSRLPALDGIASLLDKSLVRREASPNGQTRLHMLETIREFASDQLAVSAERETVRQRHAEWYLAMAEGIEPGWQTAEGQGLLSALEAEHGNVRAALAWFDETGDADSLLRLAIALCSFWFHVGYLREGAEWLERAISLGRQTTAEPKQFGMAMSWLGQVYDYLGAPEQANAWLEEAVALRREIGDEFGIGYTQVNLSELAAASGDEATATVRLEEAVARFRAIGEWPGLSLGLERLAQSAFRQGEVDRAASLVAEALAVARDAGHTLRVAEALRGVAQVAFERGEYQQARDCLVESLSLSQRIEARFGIADALVGLAAIAGGLGQGERAVRLLGAATAVRDALTSGRLIREAQFRETEAASHGWLDADAYAAVWEAGRAMPVDEAIAEALAVTLAPEKRSDAAPAQSHAAGADGFAAELSPRQIEVLHLLCEGASNQHIADSLFISLPTVKRHVTTIFAKLGVDSRAAAVTYAHRHGLV